MTPQLECQVIRPVKKLYRGRELSCSTETNGSDISTRPSGSEEIVECSSERVCTSGKSYDVQPLEATWWRLWHLVHAESRTTLACKSCWGPNAEKRTRSRAYIFLLGQAIPKSQDNTKRGSAVQVSGALRGI